MALRLTTQAGLLAGSRAAGQIANALVGVVVVRFLSQNEFGTFRQIYLLYATLLVLTDLGLCESLYYFLPRQPQRNVTILRRAILATGALQIVAGAALLGFAAQIGRFFNNPQLPSFMGLFALALGLNVMTRQWDVQLIAAQKIPLAAVVSGGFEVLKVVFLLVAVILVPDVRSLLWAMVAAGGLKFLAYGWYLAKEYGLFTATAPGGGASEQFSYALALGGPAILNIAATQAHQFIVGYSFLPAEYAVYSVACFQVPFIGVLATSIIEVMLVRITTARAQERYNEVRRVWNSACTKALMIFMPMAVGLAALSTPLISLFFTRRYAEAAPLFSILMIALPLQALFTDNVLRAYGEMKSYSGFYASRLALGLGLGAAGVYFFHLWGVAISSVLALAIIKGWQLRKVASLLKVPYGSVLPWMQVAKIALASAVAALPAAACARFIGVPAIALAVGLPLYAVVYLLLAFWLGLVQQEEILAVWNEVKSFFAGRSKEIPAKAVNPV